MVRTKDGLFAEMATAMVVAALIPKLEEVAPESHMLRELREALRCAHPACFDEKGNPELHAEFRGGIGRTPQSILAGLQLPTTPVLEPKPAPGAAPPSSAAVGAAAPAEAPASGGLTVEDANNLRELLATMREQKAAAAGATPAAAVPPVVPGDEKTGRVG